MKAAFVLFVMLAGARVADAKCMAGSDVVQVVTREAVFLGAYTDLLGHRASLYWDVDDNVVIGPVDHDRWPNGAGSKPGAPPTVAAGTRGALALEGLVGDSKRPRASSGTFVSFKAGTKKAADLEAILARISDPFVIGLLAGASPVEASAAKQVAAMQQGNPEGFELAAEGILYAAPVARVRSLLGKAVIHSAGGASFEVVSVLAREGLAGVAKLPAPAHKSTWIDYLPELAAHASDADLKPLVDKLLLGQLAPTLASVTTSVELPRHHCGPDRTRVRGPFAGPGELYAWTIHSLLTAKDSAFAGKVIVAFAGAAAGYDQYVVADRVIDGARVVFVIGLGLDGLQAFVVPATTHASYVIGAKLRWVARNQGAAPVSLALGISNDNATALPFAGTVVTSDIGKVDVPAMLAALEQDAESSHLGAPAGAALMTAFELADHVPGWTVANARAWLATLPGNVYDRPEQWTEIWTEILAAAIDDSSDGRMAAEVDTALPALIARTAARPGNAPPSTIEAVTARNFAIAIEMHVAARRIALGDLAGAAKALDHADAPLSTLAGGAQITAEAARDANHVLMLKIMRDLVAASRHAHVTLGTPADTEQAMSLLRFELRDVDPPLLAAWVAALVAAGYPSRP